MSKGDKDRTKDKDAYRATLDRIVRNKKKVESAKFTLASLHYNLANGFIDYTEQYQKTEKKLKKIIEKGGE